MAVFQLSAQSAGCTKFSCFLPYPCYFCLLSLSLFTVYPTKTANARITYQWGEFEGRSVSAATGQSNRDKGCEGGRGDEVPELSELKWWFGSYCTAAVACFLAGFSDTVSAVQFSVEWKNSLILLAKRTVHFTLNGTIHVRIEKRCLTQVQEWPLKLKVVTGQEILEGFLFIVKLQYISVNTTIWYTYLLQYNIYNYSSYITLLSHLQALILKNY
jgi:hypothetical protein